MRVSHRDAEHRDAGTVEKDISVSFVLSVVLFLFLLVSDCRAVEVPSSVREAEQHRVEVVGRLSRSTIAIFEETGTNGGSGVLISSDGYAITNFHVTVPCGPRMTCGTSDGKTHEAVLVGLDPTGDIALIRLLGDGPFSAAKIGDSDSVRIGDVAIVAGNPFLLAEDFSPSISVGIISGTHRYQFPAGSLLEYTDCLQTDAAINPGNSGGPLFDGEGQLIGINGRGSFEKRGRVNVGIGYAVSINQVMRFLSHLKSGRVVDHASLGVTVRTVRHESGESMAMVDAIDTRSDAYRRGLRAGDELVAIGGHEVRTANEFLNRIGVLPSGWRTRLVFRRETDRGTELVESDVRLGDLHAPGELEEAVTAQQAPPSSKNPPPQPGPPPTVLPTAKKDAPWRKFYAKRQGYANYFYSAQETERVLSSWLASIGTKPREQAVWSAHLTDTMTGDRVKVVVDAKGVLWDSPHGRRQLVASRDFSEQRMPAGAPGLLASLWTWRQAMTLGLAPFDDAFYIGQLPWHAEAKPCEAIRVEHRGAIFTLYFDRTNGDLIGIEASLNDSEDRTRLGFVGTNRWAIELGPQLYGDYGIKTISQREGAGS